jgi:flagellar FliJ protein
MKKFKFSLEKILQLKEQILKNLKNDLSFLQLALKEKEAEIQDLWSKYYKTDNEYKERSSKSIMPYEIAQYKDYMSYILNMIKKKEEEKLVIIKKVEAKKQEIINMNIEISTLEKLKEKKLIKYNYNVQKMEEILIEEFVSNLTSVSENRD